MQITTILPVSRVGYLDRVLESLKNQTFKSQSLIVVFDGSDEDFITVRNKVIGQPYQQVLCVKSTNARPAFAISERRQHIANIHNQLRDLIGDTDWVFSVEDDGILPAYALSYLINAATSENILADQQYKVGMMSGVELGRWGVPYVGAWRVDDIHEPKIVTSVDNKTLSHPNQWEKIDGCGLYCALIKGDLYKQHVFGSHNGLGPDVNLGLFCRQQGYQNYIDWGVWVTHLTNRNGIEIEIPATDLSQVVRLTPLGHNTWHQVKYPYGANIS